MLLSASTCPLCQRSISGQEARCPHCRAVIQLTLEPPHFSRDEVVQSLVYPALHNSRRRISLDGATGYDFYVLGLGYLNYEMPEEGLELWNQAAMLLPTQDRIHFELAMIHFVRGEYQDGLHEIDQAIRLAPDNTTYKQLRDKLRETTVQSRGDVQSMVRRWIVGYEQNPDNQSTRSALQSFVDANQERLTQPIALLLRGLSPRDAEKLRVLNDNPEKRAPNTAGGPKAPDAPGPARLRLVRRVVPERAEAMEQMYESRIAVFNQANEDYQAQQRSLIDRHSAAVVAWQGQDSQIRADLPLMARLCVALTEEETRLQQALDKRKSEWEAVEQEELLQQSLQQAATASGKQQRSQPVAKPLELRYLFSWCNFVTGLANGAEGDRVALTVTNLNTIIFHPESSHRWKQVTASKMLVEAAEETLTRAAGSKKCLRITFVGQDQALEHLFLTDLDLEIADAVRNIERAMGRTVSPAAVSA